MADLNKGRTGLFNPLAVWIPVERNVTRMHCCPARCTRVGCQQNGDIGEDAASLTPMKTRRLEEERFGLTGVTPSLYSAVSLGKKRGVVNADLRADSTLIKPELYGSAALEDVVVVSYRLGAFRYEPSGQARFVASLPP